MDSARECVAGRGSALEVLRIFTRLGCTSFGGPIAHLGYFRNEFVTRRRWLSEPAYADLVGLCQFLPGPASSKLGFSLGLMRAGYPGALAAWCGFTFPSALLLFLFALAATTVEQSSVGQALLHSLKLVAVAIVAQAVWGMARNLCPDLQRASIAVASAVLVLLASSSIGQISAIVLGAMLGLLLCSGVPQAPPEALPLPVSRRAGVLALTAFGLLLGMSFLPLSESGLALFSAFFRSGALVFGGGHVVLPLLSQAVVEPGWISEASFLAGYGAAQAVPGPLFSFAAYLGAVTRPGGVGPAALALIAIFLPGLLLHLGALPFWNRLRGFARMQSALRGINAAVVGVLAAALYRPVLSSSVLGPTDFAIALIGFILLTFRRVPAVWVVVLTAAAGTAAALTGADGLILSRFP